jgi:hypothetical protein
MKKITGIVIISCLVLNLIILVPQPFPITIQAKAQDYGMDTYLGTVDASFKAENGFHATGQSISGAGDVNGDGYDDIIIGSRGNNSGRGKVYLIFGNSSGWSMDIDLKNADASFVGECDWDSAGKGAGVGDVNNDSYDDILITAPGNGYGGDRAGQIYLIFGNDSGWGQNVNLSTISTTFIGEKSNSAMGKIAGAGDVNGDGYDDILIGCGGWNSWVYLMFGKGSGWSKYYNL